MKKQRLELHDDFFPNVESGQKLNTLRWNEGGIVEGYLEFYGTENPELKSLVFVTNTKTAPLSSFSDFYNTTPEALHSSMLKHYKNIKIDSEATLIKYLSPKETASLSAPLKEKA